MAHNEQQREKILEVLAATPFINHACKKAAISRATVYRWMKDNYRFKQKVLKALGSGRENLVEVAEVAIVNKIRNGDLGAAKFFLTHNSKRYSRDAEPFETELEKKDPLEAFRGLDGNLTMSPKMREHFIKKHEEKMKRKARALGFTEPDEDD